MVYIIASLVKHSAPPLSCLTTTTPLRSIEVVGGFITKQQTTQPHALHAAVLLKPPVNSYRLLA